MNPWLEFWPEITENPGSEVLKSEGLGDWESEGLMYNEE